MGFEGPVVPNLRRYDWISRDRIPFLSTNIQAPHIQACVLVGLSPSTVRPSPLHPSVIDDDLEARSRHGEKGFHRTNAEVTGRFRR